MCYAIPGKVETIEGNIAVVSYFGQKKKAINELCNVVSGDYVYAQAGYVIEKLAADQAQDILAAWKDVFSSLQEVDASISRINQKGPDDNIKLRRILDKACDGKSLDNNECLYLLNLEKGEDTELFFKTANFLRQKYHQNACCVHGIIEISNHCKRNCSYCGISTNNTHLLRYRMNRQEIFTAVDEAIRDYGFKAILLQAGEDSGYSINELAEIIREIKQRHPVLIMVSFGEVGIPGLEKLFSAGARGLLMRFETSNPKLYSALCPGYNLENRLLHIREAFRMGYLIFTGALIGLPGQTDQDIVNDIFLARELNAEMFSFGPFIASPHTPLAKSKFPSQQDILKTLSLIRFIAPQDAKVLVTTAFETLSATARSKALLSGANSLMLNITPLKYRPLYSIYPARAHEKEEIGIQVNQVIQLLKSLGRVPIDLGTIVKRNRQ